MNFVVLSSSRGTTLQAVLDALHSGTLHAHCMGLVSDRADRGCVEKAKKAGIPVTIVEKKKGEEREAYDKRVDEAIRAMGDADTLAALGWMFLFSPWFIDTWRNRILNVHPALLPLHPGAHAIEETLEAGDPESGMTIHLIDEGIDTGPIVLQKTCEVKPDDTVETLKERIQALEKELYPKVLEQLHTGELKLPS
jgi:phosphoribosylglycinamide formyltransferase-1